MTNRAAASTQSENLPDDIIDLGPRLDYIRATVPVPDDAGIPDVTRYGQPAQHPWPVRDTKGQLVGYLCLYVTGQVLLWIYGTNPTRRQDWQIKRARALELALTEHKLKERPSATIIVASHDQQVPSAVSSELEGDTVVVRATMRLDDEEVQVSAEPHTATSSRLNSRKAQPEDPIVRAARLRAEEATTRECAISTEPATPGRAKAQDTPPPVARPAPEAVDMLEGTVPSQRGTEQPASVMSISPRSVPGTETSELSIIRAADLVSEPIEYIWKGRIACGKLTMVAGDPGLGKSVLAVHLAATVSQGRSWTAGEDPAPRGSVILVTTEDDHNDTVRPRLGAAGADLHAVHLLSELDLTQDFDALERSVDRIPDVKLIIIDPITSCFGRANLNGTAEVRGILNPLARFAARTGIAVVFITHLNKKGSGRALTRATGSHAFVAVARLAFTLCKDASDPGRRLLLPMKNNLGVADQGVAFRIEETAIGSGTAPRLVFDSEPVTITADEALNGADRDNSRRSAVDEAKEFLLDCLAAGAVPVPDVQGAARAAGITPMSLRRAKDALGIQSKKSDMKGKWLWVLPPDANMINPVEDAQVK